MSTEPSTGGTYLVELFRGYTSLVLDKKLAVADAIARQRDAESQGAELELRTAEESDSQAAVLQQQLKGRIEELAQEVLRRGDEREQRRFREVQYVMAAFTDEIFLALVWDGQDYWREHLLEEQLFSSHHAGTMVFARIEELLRRRDPTQTDVAAAYLIALSLGFRGRYRELAGEQVISRYRQQLFAFLFQKNPGLGQDLKLYPQAYSHTLSNQAQSWLPALRPWLIAIAALCGLYVLISHVIWSREAGKIERMVGDIRR